MIESRYYFDTHPVSDFSALCARFTGNKLQSPYRSTVPLLSLVQHDETKWNALLNSLGAPTDSAIHLEYCVASPKPRGNPSQTDALIASEATVWAIEAKWTEPRYETVAKRLQKRESDGGDPRVTLNGWLGHLQPFATHELQIIDFTDVVYQVLHRAASVCAVATSQKRKPHLVYLHFYPSPLQNSATTDQYTSDLRQLQHILGKPSDLAFTVVEMEISYTPAFERIKDLNRRERTTAAIVSKALCAGPLFQFGPPIVTCI